MENEPPQAPPVQQGVPVLQKRSGFGALSILSLIIAVLAVAVIYAGAILNLLDNSAVISAPIALASASIVLAIIALVRSDKRNQRILLAVFGSVISAIALFFTFFVWLFVFAIGEFSISDKIDVEFGKFEVTTSTENEFTTTNTKLEVLVTNISDSKLTGSVTVEAVGADSVRFATDMCYFEALQPSRSFRCELFNYVEDDEITEYQNATFELIESNSWGDGSGILAD